MKELTQSVCALAIEVGDYLREERLKLDSVTSQAKGIHDYVTAFDKESERRLVTRLHELLPQSGFIAEEGTATHSGKEQYLWIVDPLDGTTNFIHGFRTTCISIALYENQGEGRGRMVLGVVYEIWARECFYSYLGAEGAFLNGKPIHVSKAATTEESLIATGFPYTDFSRLDQYMLFLKWTMRHTHGVRRFGSAAADLAYVACGRVDGFYEYSLKPYDVAAGAFLIQQAGGLVSDFSGGSNWLFGGEIVAANAALFPTLQQTLDNFLGQSPDHK